MSAGSSCFVVASLLDVQTLRPCHGRARVQWSFLGSASARQARSRRETGSGRWRRAAFRVARSARAVRPLSSLGFGTSIRLKETRRMSLPAPVHSLSAESARLATLALSEPHRAVRCVACAHRCLIRPGRAGICRVRENRDGALVTLVYGRAVAANADPIEKKPLFHVYPGSVAYSIATRGCNFHCLHCQNWAISQVGAGRVRGPLLRPGTERRRQGRSRRRIAQHRLHVHRADDLHRVRARHRPPGRRGRPGQRPGDERLPDTGGARPSRTPRRCRQRRSQVVRRSLLPARSAALASPPSWPHWSGCASAGSGSRSRR